MDDARLVDTVLVDTVRTVLRAAADPARAAGAQAYMKTTEPFLGVRVPEVRRLVGEAARAHPPSSVDELAAAVRTLWREAAYREERYAAQALTRLPLARGALELLPLYEEMISTGAWWDLVDETAGRIGELLLARPETLAPVVRTWARSPDRWLRRTAVIAQRGANARTDVDLLAEVVRANAEDPDFFLRKAIGWALRDYARTDPDWVRAFVAAQPLSPLSRREATRHLH